MSRDDQSEYPTPDPSESRKKSKKRAREEAAEATPTEKVKKSKKEQRQSKKDISQSAENIEDTVSQKHAVLKGPSPFSCERVSLYVTLSPVAYGSPLEGAVAEHISPLLLTYYPPLDGVVMSFDDAALSTRPDARAKVVETELLGQSIDEYGVTYMWLSADFTVLRPLPGRVLEGTVNVQNHSMLGLLCYNYFNASIANTDLPKEWNWTKDQSKKDRPTGYFEDENGSEIQDRLPFKVKDFEATISDGGTGTIAIFGTMQE